MPGHVLNKFMTALPNLTNRYGYLPTTLLLAQPSPFGFRQALYLERKNEAREKASEASADHSIFPSDAGLALSLQRGTSTS